MSWLRRLRGQPRSGQPEAQPVEQPPAPLAASDPSQLDSLLRPELDPDRALRTLSSARSTGAEREALGLLRRAKAESRAPEALCLLGADIHVERGEREHAEALLEGLTSTEALLFAADLAAEREEFARALTLVERVLARDIDTPGARERHTRWQVRIGAVQRGARDAAAYETIITAEPPDTSLRIVGEAGRGGAGTVFEAVDEVLGRRVALKVYHRPEGEQDKLEREARYAVDLAGRGVVRVFDVDPARGVIVMEWLALGALKRWLTLRDRDLLLPIERWFLPLVRATARVHARGLVHADIKPANVLFRSPDEPVLSDFGLTHAEGLVVEGGSRGYLSPERLAGQPIAPRDDVYALGRLVEDAVQALAPSEHSGQLLRGGRIAALCIGEGRPASAAALLEVLRAEHAA